MLRALRGNRPEEQQKAHREDPQRKPHGAYRNTKKAHRLKSEQPAEATKCEQRNIKGTKPLQQK